MADELDIQLNQPSESEKRINQLSGKLKEVGTEKDEALKKADQAERRATFAEGFVDVVSAHPAAKDYKDEIQKKVLENGYSVEDATLAVLAKNNKLTSMQTTVTPTETQTESPAGGSASFTPPQGEVKSPTEMTQEERRKALEQDLSWG